MQFGQFLDHDLTLTPESEAEDCCTEEALSGRFAPGCFPILFADSDPTFANLGWKKMLAIAPNISQRAKSFFYFLKNEMLFHLMQFHYSKPANYHLHYPRH